jgi:hypothetical protein
MAKTKKLGDLVNQTISTNAPLIGGANLTDTLSLSITKANTTTDGYVSATDWNIFNNKQDALGFTPYNATNPDGYISGITSGMVTTALGFTPYDSANPDGYITSSALTSYVPYTGATADVDLGSHSLTASDLIIDHASGSGVAASITKGGSGEALTVVKSSGSGNVASFTGGNTFISTLTTPTINGVSGNLAFANAVQTSGAVTAFTFTKPNNTTQTASTQINGFVVNGGTRQWNTGNIATQSENVWGATTYSFVGTSTITNAYGNVFNAPVAGTNATITNNWAAQFNGNVVIGSTGQLIEIKQTTNSPTYTQTGATNSTFSLKSGTRTLEFVSVAGDQNYFSSTGANFRIRTTDSNNVQIYTNGIARWTFGFDGNFYVVDNCNFLFGTTNGNKFGTTTTQKIGFWNATPIVQPTTSVTASTFVSNTSMILNDTATFDGYTIGQVVKALRNMGLLA